MIPTKNQDTKSLEKEKCMRTIALVHTVKTVANTFEDKIRTRIEEPLKIYNLLDDFLALHPNEVGEFTITNKNRLYHDLKNAELTGADLIVVTCSTLTPVVEELRSFMKVPVIAIDDAMGRKAVETGNRILIYATAGSTVVPTRNKLEKEGRILGRTVQLFEKVCAEAFAALKTGQMEIHDQLLLEEAKSLKDVDCIVLAQASMAHLQKEMERITNIPVLASPDLCIEDIRTQLKQL